MTIYISGAITGTTDYMERFERAEVELKKQGYEAINPAKVNSHLPTNSHYDFYMEMSLVMVKNSDAIYMLDGWENSKGANMEYQCAEKWKKNIFYESAKN